jgi:hypothetical protein
MVRNLFLASAFLLGAAGVAQAQSAPQLVGGGEDAQLVYSPASQNVVGGGTARVTGGGLDRSFSYGAVTALRGPVASMVGGGENSEVVYQASPTAPLMAQRVTLQPRG